LRSTEAKFGEDEKAADGVWGLGRFPSCLLQGGGAGVRLKAALKKSSRRIYDVGAGAKKKNRLSWWKKDEQTGIGVIGRGGQKNV